LKDKGWKVIYYADVTEFLGGTVDHSNDARVIQNRQVWTKYTEKKILLIIDQFEEFFINSPNTAPRTKMAEELSQLMSENNCKIIIGIRKDFVEDIRSFASVIKDPKADINSLYIQNWELDPAKKYFSEMCDLDGQQFSQQLRDDIITDLGSSGLVRPIELQMVSDYCLKKIIINQNDYRKTGRAKGILRNFIIDIINDIQTNQAETERFIAKFILRNLCSDLFNTKRTDGGVTYESLYLEVRKSLAQTPGIVFDEQYHVVFKKVIVKLFDYRVIALNQAGKYNASHDYLVKSIKEATADVQTNEEQVVGMVRERITKQSYGLPGHLTVSEYWLILTGLPENAWTDVEIRKFMNQERTRYMRIFSGLVFLITVVFYFYFPAHDVFVADPIAKNYYENRFPGGYNQKNSFVNNDTVVYPAVRYEVNTPSLFFTLVKKNASGDTVTKHIALSEKVFWILKGKELLAIPKNSNNLIRYDISHYRLAEKSRIALPNWISDQNYFVTIGNSAAGIALTSRLYFEESEKLMYYIDGNGWAIYDLNTDKKLFEMQYPSNEIDSQNQGNLVKVGQTMLVFQQRNHSVRSAIYGYDKNSGMIRMDTAVQKLFQTARLFYDEGYNVLYYFNLEKNTVTAFKAFVPVGLKQLGDESLKLGEFKVDSETQNYLLTMTPDGLSFDFRNDKFKLYAAGNNIYIFQKESSQYMDSVYLIYKNRNVQRKLKGEYSNFSQIVVADNERQFLILPYSKYSSAKNTWLSAINKVSFAREDSLMLFLRAVNKLKDGSLDIVYTDSKANLNLVNLSGKVSLKSFAKGSMIADMGTKEYGETYWSNDQNLIFYKEKNMLFFGEKHAFLKNIFKDDDEIGTFFTSGTELLLNTGSNYYSIKRYENVFGINLWQKNWPEVNSANKSRNYLL